MLERWHQVKAEILRRMDDGDPELYYSPIKGLEIEASLLPSIPNMADFIPRKLINISSKKLDSDRKRWQGQLRVLQQTYPDTRKIRDWLDRSLIERRQEAIEEICRNIGHELIRRDAGANEGATGSTRSPRREDPEVAKRRTVVRNNLSLADDDLCKQLDWHSIALPFEADVTTWVDAYRNPKLRQRIHVMLSKDRAHIKQK